MSLQAGHRVGGYEIVSLIGAGGMGQVYRARDTKLGRDVALKVIPPLFAEDHERLARFRREAQLLASLTHPHIGQIYGVEESGATHALVLELIEGQTLSERIAEGPVPVTEALRIAGEIADALAAAHEVGIVHRDLKPANIKIREDGHVKVLDFGLAKALGADPASAASEPSNSPTLTSHGTQLGVILGTAGYMAPEQAKGKPIDRRADVWAFGVVLYEMLTGRRLFEGEDVSDTLAAVLTREPDWHQLPATTPPVVRRLLARCLARDRRARLDSMSSVRLDIDEALHGPASGSDPSLIGAVPAPLVSVASSRARSRLAIPAIALGSAAVGWALAAWVFPAMAGGDNRAPTTIASVLPPDGVVSAFHRGFALSPDGLTIVVSAKSPDGSRALWRRRLSQPQYELVAGTDDAMYPFWSPDSREIGFTAGRLLKRVPVDGGPVQVISKLADPPEGATWTATGDILFSPGRGPSQDVFRVPAGGGTPELLPLDGTGFSPQWIPDTRSFLFIRADANAAQAWVGSLDGSHSPRRVLDLELRDPGVVVTPTGLVLFNREGVLHAQRFDPKALEMVGAAHAIGPAAGTPRAWLGASAGGDSIVVLSGNISGTGGNPGDPVSRLSWVDRRGAIVGDMTGPGRFWTLRLSPDADRAVVNPDKDLWVVDDGTKIRNRVTAGPYTYSGAIWSPDGMKLLYREPTGLWTRSVDGREPPAEVLKFGSVGFGVGDWSPDGKRVMLVGGNAATSSADLFLLELGEAEPRPLFPSEFQETHPRFSPSGGWVAYVSNMTGRPEVYARPLSGDAGAVRLSADGGEHPIWRRQGGELYYLSPSDEFVAVDVSRLEETRQPGARRTLFRLVVNDVIRDGYAPYDVTADGQRFLVNVTEPSEPLTLIQGLTRLVEARR